MESCLLPWVLQGFPWFPQHPQEKRRPRQPQSRWSRPLFLLKAEGQTGSLAWALLSLAPSLSSLWSSLWFLDNSANRYNNCDNLHLLQDM